MKTSFKIKDLEFKNRVFVASGTFGYGDEVSNLIDVNRLGGIITKSITYKPRLGNPPDRIAETNCGVLNSIGLANIGVEKFIKEKLSFLNTLDTVIIVNIAGGTYKEYCLVVEKLELVSGVDAYEINISCPNVKEGGLNFGTDVRATAEITKQIRQLTDKPIIIKLTPNVTRISEYARAAESEGADALSLINTLVGLAIDIKTHKPKLSTVTGGLSGPAIKPVALAKVYEAVQSVKIPVIGIGGILTTEDALEYFIVGAVAVQIGTANFIDPTTAVRIVEGIEKYCTENNYDDIQQIIGTLDTSSSFPVLKTWL